MYKNFKFHKLNTTFLIFKKNYLSYLNKVEININFSIQNFFGILIQIISGQVNVYILDRVKKKECWGQNTKAAQNMQELNHLTEKK